MAIATGSSASSLTSTNKESALISGTAYNVDGLAHAGMGLAVGISTTTATKISW